MNSGRTAPRRDKIFDFPGGIGPVECVNLEHAEVLLIPRWTKAKRVTGKTAVNPCVALELLADGRRSGVAVLDPEALPHGPFLNLLTAYGSPWGMQEQPV